MAVLGHAATTEQVEALGLDPMPTPCCEALVTAGLLRRQGGEDAYDVADPLLGEVAYETLPRQVRVERHRLVAERATSGEDRDGSTAARICCWNSLSIQCRRTSR